MEIPDALGENLVSSVTFEAKKERSLIKYVVDILKQKKKFNEGLIVRKVRITRKVYREDLQGLLKLSSGPPEKGPENSDSTANQNEQAKTSEK